MLPKLTYLLIVIATLFSCIAEPIDINQQTIDPSEVHLTLKTLGQYEIMEDIGYGYHEQQKFDLYLPEDRNVNTTKVVVLLHGGAWQNGDKSAVNDLVQMIQTELPNVAIANSNFVLASEDHPAFPNQFNDINALLNLITTRSEEFQVNPEFAILGRSSGGHLALMYDYLYDSADRVKVVGSISGPTDFTDDFYQDHPNVEAMLSILIDENEYANQGNIFELLSPLYHVTSNSSPTILFHGENDPVVPFSNAVSLQNALHQNSPLHELHSNQEGHGNWPIEVQAQVQVEFAAFLESYLIN